MAVFCRVLRLVSVVIVSSLLSGNAVFAQSSSFQLYTEEYPPYNYQEGKQLHGTTTEMVREVLEKLNIGVDERDILLVPWAWGYSETLNRKNTALFSMARTEEREKLFLWVGPVGHAQIGIVARKEKGIKIDSLDGLKNYKIGVVREDVGHQLLRKMSPDLHLELTNSAESNLRKLKEKRIDLFVYDINVVSHVLLKSHLNPDDFETVFILKEVPFYIGFNLNTDPKLFNDFQKAFQEMQDEVQSQ